MRNGHYVIDAHCHIYPEKIANKAAVNISDFYDGIPYIGGDVTTLLQLMEQQGIDHAVVNSAAMSPRQVAAVNRFLLDKATEHPDKFSPVGSVHPDCTPEELDAAIQFLTENGFHGIKIHPDMLHIPVDDPRMLEIYGRCQAAGLPVLLHTGDKRYDFSNPNRLERILPLFPDLTVIGGHFAGRDMFTEAADRLHGFSNLFTDCSSAFDAMTREEAIYCFQTYGTHRIMFGTDYPVCQPHYDMDFLLSLPIEGEALGDVFWRNAVKIYKLSPPWGK